MQIGSFQAPNGELHSSPGHSNKIKQHVCAMCAHERANFAIGGKGGGQGTNGGQTWTAAAEAHFDTFDTLTIDPPKGTDEIIWGPSHEFTMKSMDRFESDFESAMCCALRALTCLRTE